MGGFVELAARRNRGLALAVICLTRDLADRISDRFRVELRDFRVQEISARPS